MHENISDKMFQKARKLHWIKLLGQGIGRQQKQGWIKRNDIFILRHMTNKDKMIPPKFWNEMFLNLEFSHISNAN